jgi:hypothetical protein
MALVLMSKQAFANYYWLAAGLLLGATATLARERSDPAGASSASLAP